MKWPEPLTGLRPSEWGSLSFAYTPGILILPPPFKIDFESPCKSPRRVPEVGLLGYVYKGPPRYASPKELHRRKVSVTSTEVRLWASPVWQVDPSCTAPKLSRAEKVIFLGIQARTPLASLWVRWTPEPPTFDRKALAFCVSAPWRSDAFAKMFPVVNEIQLEQLMSLLG